MNAPGRFIHYVRRNEITRVPRRHIFLDVEAVEEETPYGREQFWRLGVAHFWAAPKDRKETNERHIFDDPSILWKQVDGFCKSRTRTVLWAHNLAYDVRVSRAFVELPLLGWILERHNMGNGGCWLNWRKGEASLVMVDSASVFPLSLAQVGAHFGVGKPELPRFDDERDLWVARCQADVDILTTAIKAYIGWLDHDDMGNWQQTGAGQAWATFRHKYMRHRIMVHDDAAALVAERRAMWTGRCEAYWHGALRGQVLHEWDLTLAYARIAHDSPVPTKLLRPLSEGDVWQRYLGNPHLAVLAEVTVQTDVPVVPTLVAGHIAWPVGKFHTTLWGPEIAQALKHGATITLHRGWLYRCEPALREWAAWILAALDDSTSDIPAWQKVILKTWARTLIGRFAMTYTAWDAVAQAPDMRVRRVHYHDTRTGTGGELLQIGTALFEKSGVTEWQHSVPSITGFIMSACRVRLWNIMSALPDRAVLYCDTDSILATDMWHDTIKAVADSPIGHGLRLKRSWDGFSIWGPRQIATGEVTRVAGIPKRAVRTGRNTFQGEIWESLETATRRARFDRVAIAPRKWTMKGLDRRRVGAGLGWTHPHRVSLEQEQ